MKLFFLSFQLFIRFFFLFFCFIFYQSVLLHQRKIETNPFSLFGMTKLLLQLVVVVVEKCVHHTRSLNKNVFCYSVDLKCFCVFWLLFLFVNYSKNDELRRHSKYIVKWFEIVLNCYVGFCGIMDLFAWLLILQINFFLMNGFLMLLLILLWLGFIGSHDW